MNRFTVETRAERFPRKSKQKKYDWVSKCAKNTQHLQYESKTCTTALIELSRILCCTSIDGFCRLENHRHEDMRSLVWRNGNWAQTLFLSWITVSLRESMALSLADYTFLSVLCCGLSRPAGSNALDMAPSAGAEEEMIGS